VYILVDFKKGDVHFQKKDTILRVVADSEKVRQGKFRLQAVMYYNTS